MPQAPSQYLSNTFRSDRIITPGAPNRASASKFLYSQQNKGLSSAETIEWGRGKDYGLHTVMPIGNENFMMKVKGHRHYNGGSDLRPEDVAQYQVYTLTELKRSATRPWDHLVPAPQTLNIQERQIKKEFPRNHTYFSHISNGDIFPQHKAPTKSVAVLEEEQADAEDSDGEIDFDPVLNYSREFKPFLKSTTKGSAWRAEKSNKALEEWRPAPVPRPADMRMSASAYNAQKAYGKGLKQTHYQRVHEVGRPPLLSSESTPDLSSYKPGPGWKHDILKNFNATYNEKIPDLRKTKEKRHLFNGVNVMQIEHG